MILVYFLRQQRQLISELNDQLTEKAGNYISFFPMEEDRKNEKSALFKLKDKLTFACFEICEVFYKRTTGAVLNN